MHCNAMHYLDMLITNITLPSSFQKKGCLTNHYRYLFCFYNYSKISTPIKSWPENFDTEKFPCSEIELPMLC